MSEDQKTIAQLFEKLDALMKRQEAFRTEIEELRSEISNFRIREAEPQPIASDRVRADEQNLISPLDETKTVGEPEIPSEGLNLWEKAVKTPYTEENKRFGLRSGTEKFIGENLINKIGIIILVIGVGIGAKYAIDHDLISPLTRIILGYLFGLGLLGFAISLKKKYENFSAVLFSGSMAIMYFITFAAYSFYSLMPLTLTFSLMVLITFFTVAAAVRYNRQVIAHIGLVGAYAVPFLLSDNSGKVAVLFSYMSIINAGILAIVLRKYWKLLYYSSFLLSWVIFITWFIPKYEDASHFGLAWTFISIFFVTFYIIFLAYKLLKKEKFKIDDILLLLANSSVFYGLGYALLYHHLGGEKLLGWFTLGNGLIHFAVSIIIYRVKQSDRKLFYFVSGLVVAFLTISIPVQLEGCWITMLWSAEAAMLFWVGRTKNAALYELLSYPLMILAFFSVTLCWPDAYHGMGNWPEEIKLIPLFNINFLTSLLFIASFGFINILNGNEKFTSPLAGKKVLLQVFNFIIPGMLLVVLYFAFCMEISGYWHQFYAHTVVITNKGLEGAQQIFNENIYQYKTLSIFIYSLLFLSVLSFVNIVKLKKSLLGLINLGFSFAAVGLFLTIGLFALGTLRESWLSQDLSQYFYRGMMLIGIRYVCFVSLGLLLFAVYKYIRQDFLSTDLLIEFDLFFHITVLTILSNELINWMDLYGSEESYKLGLSILFGVYALLLIALGIWKKKLHLRIGAIVLFGLTLLKLFFYDLSSLDTISKTIVFVVLGLLLLIISFLYTKYRKVIFEDKNE
jgi:uncharacterized membrane protein